MTSTELPEPRSRGIDYTPVTDYAGFVAYLGEGLHTGLRKAAESAAASRAHSAISQMPDDEWAGVIRFVAGPLWLAMQSGGLVRPHPDDADRETTPAPARRTITRPAAVTS